MSLRRLGSGLLFIILFMAPVQEIHSAEASYHLLYFYSGFCPHCRKTTPVIADIAGEIPVQGLYYAKDKPEKQPFPVRPGTRQERDKFGLRGVPSVVILEKDKIRLSLSGEQDVLVVKKMLKALKAGALTVSEATESIVQKELLLTGWLGASGDQSGQHTRYYLTDRKKILTLTSWPPREEGKRALNGRQWRLLKMVNRPILLKGSLSKQGNGLHFIVREEIPIE